MALSERNSVLYNRAKGGRTRRSRQKASAWRVDGIGRTQLLSPGRGLVPKPELSPCAQSAAVPAGGVGWSRGTRSTPGRDVGPLLLHGVCAAPAAEPPFARAG